MPKAATEVLTADEMRILEQLRVESHGIFGAAAILGVSRDTFERAQHGIGIRRGSAALIRQALAARKLSGKKTKG